MVCVDWCVLDKQTPAANHPKSEKLSLAQADFHMLHGPRKLHKVNAELISRLVCVDVLGPDQHVRQVLQPCHELCQAEECSALRGIQEIQQQHRFGHSPLLDIALEWHDRDLGCETPGGQSARTCSGMTGSRGVWGGYHSQRRSKICHDWGNRASGHNRWLEAWSIPKHRTWDCLSQPPFVRGMLRSQILSERPLYEGVFCERALEQQR